MGVQEATTDGGHGDGDAVDAAAVLRERAVKTVADIPLANVRCLRIVVADHASVVDPSLVTWSEGTWMDDVQWVAAVPCPACREPLDQQADHLAWAWEVIVCPNCETMLMVDCGRDATSRRMKRLAEYYTDNGGYADALVDAVLAAVGEATDAGVLRVDWVIGPRRPTGLIREVSIEVSLIVG